MTDVIGRNMTFYVVYSNQWFARRITDRLCRSYTDQKGSHQPWTIGHTDPIHITNGQFRFFQRLLDHLVDIFNMLSGSDLRHNASI